MCLFLFVMLLVCGCEKPLIEGNNELAEQTTGNVTLHVSGFESYSDEFGTREIKDIAQVCSRLNFIVYQNGEKVKAVNQKEGDDTFGEVTLNMESGTYQVLILAHSSDGNPSQSHPEKVQFTNSIGYTDTFYYYGDMEVTAEGATLSVMLKRAVAAFRLVTTDAKPADVASIRFRYTGGSGALDAITGYGCVNSIQTATYNVADCSGSLTLEAYTFLHKEEGQLEIQVSAYNSQGATLYERTFQNVPMKRNTITEYSGTLFYGEPVNPDDPADTPDEPSMPDESGDSSGFVFQVDDEWAELNQFSF